MYDANKQTLIPKWSKIECFPISDYSDTSSFQLALNIIGIQEFNLEPNLLTRTLEFDAMKRKLSESYLATVVQVLKLSTN